MSTAATRIASPLGRYAGPLGRVAAPALAALLVLAVWEGAVSALGISSFVLPPPSAIFSALADNAGTILKGLKVTVVEVLVGLAMGTTAGVLVALVVARFKAISTPVLVLAIVLNCAPIVALAPIANNWLGVTSMFSKASVAAVMAFFPVMVSTSRGLLQIPSIDLDVMRSIAASPRQVVWRVRVPHMLPYLFSGLRLASTLAIIGAIVTEYLGGRADALGVYIAQEAAVPRYAEAWAGIVVASAFGLALFGAVVLAERIAAPWRHAQEAGQ